MNILEVWEDFFLKYRCYMLCFVLLVLESGNIDLENYIVVRLYCKFIV